MSCLYTRKLRSRKKRLRKKHPYGMIFIGLGFRPKKITVSHGGGTLDLLPQVTSFDKDGFTFRFLKIGS